MKLSGVFIVLFLSLNSFFVSAQTIDSNKSVVNFKITGGAIFNVKGTFTGMQGDFNFNETDLNNSSFNICIDAQSIDTDNSKRDADLRSADFFDVETYSTICYKSDSVTKTSNGYSTTGSLTIRGVTNTVTIPFTFKDNRFEGDIEIERLDYNIGEDYGSFRVGKTASVTIICVVKP
ncbi:YceI family protein [Xanthomarina sp. F1114]|uniref:YceI family protein n=1 Tax=Xanthomarina sp. F1114 TaxID=2996019 RepID=UPI00225E4A09|nr:YceI family protein [Xanthomarina sp. F1114]MCX7547834.1 YceI family protein [Xanthomarina sp. F1114]